jgi:hypothetical protein
MNTSLQSYLKPHIIAQLDCFIDTTNPSQNCKLLSNHQIPHAIYNLQIIQNVEQPSYIHAADFENGHYHCIYYRHTNKNIYVINSYLQDFYEYYSIDFWENQLIYWKDKSPNEHIKYKYIINDK